MVATTNKLSNARGWHLSVLLGEIHGNLSDDDAFAPTAAADNLLLIHAIVVAHLVENVVDGKRVVVDLDGTLDDTLGQAQVDVGVVDHGIGQQRVDDTLEVANGAICSLGNVKDDVLRNAQSVTTTLGIEDVNAELVVRLF